MKLNIKNVEQIFMNCLNNNRSDNEIIINGVAHSFSFNPDKIEKYKDNIYSMLKELPKEFHKETGDGWSFLNACMDKNNNQWGEHRNIEQLFALGMACEIVKCVMPKELWSALPGGMPYYVVI